MGKEKVTRRERFLGKAVEAKSDQPDAQQASTNEYLPAAEQGGPEQGPVL